MSALTMEHPRPMTLRRDIFAAEPALAALGFTLLALLAPTLVAGALDERTLNGISGWVKPAKFQLSLALYALTLAFFARYVPAETRARRGYRIYIGAVVAAIALETAWLMGAAANGVAAHFNNSPVGEAIYMSMGGLAVILTSASAVYAVLIGRNRDTGLPPVVKEGIVVGLALVLPLTLITAGTMSAADGNWVGGVQNDAGGLALFGWARDGGDLRVAHFFATHAMHFLPAFAIASLVVFGGGERRPLRIAAAAFVALVAFTFVQALSGRPFLPFLA